MKAMQNSDGKYKHYAFALLMCSSMSQFPSSGLKSSMPNLVILVAMEHVQANASNHTDVITS